VSPQSHGHWACSMKFTDYFRADCTKYDVAEPSELTEGQWDTIFKNNRVLHGCNFDGNLGLLVKASRPGMCNTFQSIGALKPVRPGPSLCFEFGARK
jgi:hypothetical protein